MQILGNLFNTTPLSKKRLCPFCFEFIKDNSVLYICNNSKCITANDDKQLGHIIENPKPDRNHYCNHIGGCGRNTSTIACPKCKSILPDTYFNGYTRIISIVGCSSSGKSYYVGSFLKKIMKDGLLSTMNLKNIERICTKWADKKSGSEYKNRFEIPMDSGRILEGTKKVYDLIKDNPPLLIEMTKETKKKNERITFSFFDAAGESFHNESELMAVTPYIAHSEAVIMLLDPRQIDSLNTSIEGAFSGLPKVSDVTYEEILSNITKIIKNDQKIAGDNKIKIPLCIAFSKWDLVIDTPDLLQEEFECAKTESNNQSGYDATRIENISNEIRSLLIQQWGCRNLVETAEKDFETVKYFCFSAWGSSPQSRNASKAPPIKPFRVEDPFLWVLNNNNII